MADAERIFIRCAWRLLPFLSLLFLLNYIDRVNVGFAALTMNRDLALSPSVFGFGAGLLFFAFFIFAIPSGVAAERLGARWWLFVTLFAWGLLSSAPAFVRDSTGFYAVRFLLGAAEAGFLPGAVYYLTLWFPPSRRAHYMAMFLVAGPLAFILGGPLSGAILSIRYFAGLTGWQWLFVLEGLPTSLLALAIPFVLPNSPLEARWLSEAEGICLTERLQQENVEEHRDLVQALRDVRILALGMVTFGILFGIYGTGLWLPQIVHDMGFDPLLTGIVVAVPYCVTIAAMVLWGRSSDRKHERILHTGLPLLIASAAYAVAAYASNEAVSLVALSVALMALYSALSPLSSIPLTIFGGPAAAGAMALVFAISSLGGFFGPTIIGALREASGGYSSSMLALSAVLLAASALVFAVGWMIAVTRGAVRV